MTVEDFLDHLEDVRPAGSGHVGQCPGHEDRNASLSVGEGDDGRIVLKCHAGCEVKDIVKEMGLTLRDLFPNQASWDSEPDAIYSYTDEQGNELYQAVRLPGKQFRQRHYDPEHPDAKDGWVKNLDGIRRVIYRLPEVIEAVREGRGVWIVEGEKDVETLRAAGKVATCNPMGAGKWRPEYSEFLTGANVTIIADRDEPGRAHANRVKAMLEGYALNVRILQAKEGKDATDHLEAGLSPEEFVPIRQGPRRGVVTAQQLAEAGREQLHTSELDSPGYELMPGLAVTARQGRMYAIGAYTSDGKTTFAVQIARNLADKMIRGGYYTLEMPESDIRNKLLQHKGIPLAMLEQPWQLKHHPELMAAYEQGIQEISEWNMDVIFDTKVNAEFIAQTSIDREHEFVIVDHIHRFAWGGERGRLEQAVQTLTNLAVETNIVVLLLCQLRKASRGKDLAAYPRPSLQEFRETSVIGDDSAMAMALWRQRDASGMSFTGITQLEILKNRHTTSKLDGAGTVLFPDFDISNQTFKFGRTHGHTGTNAAATGSEGLGDQGGSGAADDPVEWGGLYD